VSTSFSSPTPTPSPSPSPNSTPRRSYKVLASIPRYDGQGDYLMRVGSAFQNRDDSINLYLEAIPAAAANGRIRLQIRELDATDFARREQYRANTNAARGGDPGAFAPPAPSNANAASENVPF